MFSESIHINKQIKEIEFNNTNTVYDSSLHNEKCSVKTQICINNKSNYRDTMIIAEYNLHPKRIKIENCIEHVKVMLYFEEKIEEVKHILYEIMDTDKIIDKYPNYWVKNDILIMPDINDSMVLEFNYIQYFVWENSANSSMVSIEFPAAKTAGYNMINGSKSDYFDYFNIENIIKSKVLSKEEKERIKAAILSQNDITKEKEKQKRNILYDIFSLNGKYNRKKQGQPISLVQIDPKVSGIFDASMINIRPGIDSSEKTLDKLIGLENVKKEIKKLESKLQYKKLQEERGIYVKDENNLHMVFTGNPGTGKTTVARIITGILYDMGYIKTNACVEVNGQNLKGGYIGQTAIITREVLKNAKNKVLFIDEAYALYDEYENGYGKEAVATILKYMEDERNDIVIVFAGYKDEMSKFLRMNRGLESRINRYLDFTNYSTIEMIDILMKNLNERSLYITEEALTKCAETFKKASPSKIFSNARFVRNLIEKAEEEHAYNVRKNSDITKKDTIMIEDITDEDINELLTQSM